MYTIETTLTLFSKRGTGPMAYDDIHKYMDAAAEIGRNPVSKHQLQPECGE